MAESALSIGYGTLSSEVGRFLGYGSSSTGWSTNNQNLIDLCVDKGYRRFLMAYEWSFARSYSTMNTTAPYGTGTITLADGDATVTLADGTWPDWAAQGKFVYDNNEYEVASRTSDSEIELESAWSGDAVSGGEYELRRFAYDLEDDFGAHLGPFTYDSDNYYAPITIINESRLRSLFTGYDTTSRPLYASIRWKSTDNSTGQRAEVVFFPMADAAYNLDYTYAILTSARLRDATPYPLGGMIHAETILESCLAAGERYVLDIADGPHEQEYQRLLQNSIRKDNENAPDYLGRNMDRSDRAENYNLRGPGKFYVTVNGDLP